MYNDPHQTGMNRIIEDQRAAQAQRDREAAAQRQEDRAQAKAAKRAKATGNSESAAPADGLDSFERTAGGLIGIAIWAGVSYYGITEVPQLGLWSIGIGFVAASVVVRILMGPLKIVLVGIKWLVYLGFIGGLLYTYHASQSLP